MLLIALHFVVLAVCTAHILLRRNRQPESRIAWLVVVVALPYLGALAYLLLGHVSVGRRRVERRGEVLARLPRAEAAPGWTATGNRPVLDDRDIPLFEVGKSISAYPAVGGNRAALMSDENATIDTMIADIDRAREHVHLLFYIWLTDHTGTRVAEALMRAAKRGVTCRAIVDDMGSRALLRSNLWADMQAAGVCTGRALKVGNPLLRMLNGRVDLRNHRKIVVIDNWITYCGSQNCADPAFLPKARFGPWVDAVVRFEGPIARENQHLFAVDWMANGGDDVRELLTRPLEAASSGFAAQVIATGPTYRSSAMPELFSTLVFAAKHQLFITTPYYVPNEALQAALCASANRGVDTTMIFPARNDDVAVAGASRSYYLDLLSAGVKIHEYQAGLLHTKSLTLDGRITLIGSANMDRRSFDLNYENNILVSDAALTDAMLARQMAYLRDSRPVTRAEVEAWSTGRRLWNNAVAIVGPLL